MRWTLVVFLIGVVACSEEPVSEAEALPVDQEPGRTRRTLEQLPPMPAYPDASPGQLVVASDGDFVLDGKRPAAASLCPEQRILELYAEDDSGGTGVMLQYPEGDAVGEYPVLLPESTLVDERSARIGVQVFEERDARGFQALGGTLEVLSLDEHLSGRFKSTVRDVETDVLARYVGIFTAIPVEVLGQDYCTTLRPAEHVDTTQVATATVMNGLQN
jgi:hypothetical protein